MKTKQNLNVTECKQNETVVTHHIQYVLVSNFHVGNFFIQESNCTSTCMLIDAKGMTMREILCSSLQVPLSSY